MNWARLVCISLLALSQAACAAAPYRPAAATPGFLDYAPDTRILHEAGGEFQAAKVAELLDAAVARVESVHGLPFLAQPRIHVCVSDACFARFLPGIGYSAAVLPGDVLLLSAKLFGKESGRLRGILVHELSHLHLNQRLGHYTPWLPVWFHEGLASLAAEGGGAEFSSDEAVLAAWNEGRQVDFSRLDVPGRRNRAEQFGLDIHAFYRVSWRFMEYLRRRDGAAFNAMLQAIQNHTDITISVADAYNAGLERLASDFFDTDRQRGDQAHGG